MRSELVRVHSQTQVLGRQFLDLGLEPLGLLLLLVKRAQHVQVQRAHLPVHFQLQT